MADFVEWVSTERVGQLTGPADPQGWTLLNGDTRNWSVVGVDLGANADHEGRTYFFFGDVANNDGGRHQAIGWNFFIPNDHQGASSGERTGRLAVLPAMPCVVLGRSWQYRRHGVRSGRRALLPPRELGLFPAERSPGRDAEHGAE
jgi:hypothetical protein